MKGRDGHHTLGASNGSDVLDCQHMDLQHKKDTAGHVAHDITAVQTHNSISMLTSFGRKTNRDQSLLRRLLREFEGCDVGAWHPEYKSVRHCQ